MNSYKILFFIFIIVLIIVGPIYAVGKLVLPSWIKSHVTKNLPEGSTLSIGTMTSNYDLSINYENLLFTGNEGTFKMSLSDLVVAPQLSFKEPLVVNKRFS